MEKTLTNIRFDEPPSMMIRSQSFDVSREPNPTQLNAHHTNKSHNEGINKRYSTYDNHPGKSFARSVSSISLYSHFAGENFTHHRSNRTSRAPSFEFGKRELDGGDTSTHKAMMKSLKSEYDINSISSDEEGADAPKASVGKAMFMFLKAFIGSGVLFLPKAFDHAGLLLSIAVMVVIAIICLFAYLQLVKTQMLVGGSYGDVGQTLYGKATRYTILSFIALSQMGFVCSYFVFIAGNLVNIVDVLSHCAVQIDQKYYIWFPLIVVAPLVLIRHIAKLSFTAIIADLFILFGLVCCIYFSSQQLKTFGVGPEVKMANPSHFILTVGTAVFSFEGIGLVIPIVESMERPERFPFVVCVGVSVVCVIYIIIGAVAYLAYGSHIQAAVVYNFPQDHGLTISVQLLYSIAIVLTAPLQLFPATKILEGALFQKCLSGSESNRIKWIKNVFRLCLLSFCALIAFVVGGDNLDIFVSLVGSLACVPLCFIFPGMLHYRVANNRLEKIGDLGLCVFGVVILILTLYVTISSFITPEASGFVLPPYCPIRG